jgi:cytochrome b involved in lipid metabolism
MFFVHALSYETEHDVDAKQRSFEKNPGFVKIVSKTLWFALAAFLTYQNLDLSYFLVANRFPYLISLIVSLRDGGTSLSNVEYNIQTKNIVGMISCMIASWILSQRIMLVEKCPEQVALGVAASFLTFESTMYYVYCRPLPVARTKWDVVVEEYMMYPIHMLAMTYIESLDKAGKEIPSSYSQAIYAVLLYKFVILYLDYTKNLNTVKGSNTEPINHLFTETIAHLETKTDPTPNERDLWRIYGNTYDMSDYVHKHPGGVEAIMLGCNRDDSTSLFQAYHAFNIGRAKKVLEKYRINKSTTTTNDDVDHKDAGKVDALTSDKHENDPFYEVLRRRVAQTLIEKHNIDPIKDRIPTTARYVYYFFLLVTCVTSIIAHCKVRAIYLSMRLIYFPMQNLTKNCLLC